MLSLVSAEYRAMASCLPLVEQGLERERVCIWEERKEKENQRREGEREVQFLVK